MGVPAHTIVGALFIDLIRQPTSGLLRRPRPKGQQSAGQRAHLRADGIDANSADDSAATVPSEGRQITVDVSPIAQSPETDISGDRLSLLGRHRASPLR